MDTVIKNALPHRGFNLYNATAYVQSHTLLNRGITTLGGSTIPQCIMSNNRHEARERAIMGIIYLVASYLTPIVLIPLYSKHFLKNKGIIKNFNDAGNKIIQVSKKYLTPQGDIKKGLNETAKVLDRGQDKYRKAFNEIYDRYQNPEKLKKDLLAVHEKILLTDFITTAAMWSAIPWIATETTEKLTGRKDFSAGFNLKTDTAGENNKFKKIMWNIFFVTVPAIIFSKTVTKSLNDTKTSGLLAKINRNPQNFDYTSGTNMSKTIYASIWALSSFPAKIISARDKNERKDRALRDLGLFAMFFGGDFLINNVSGRMADKIFGTKIMDYNGKKLNFFRKFGLKLRDFNTLDERCGLSPETLKRTKNIGAGIYWFSLLANAALIGFGLPKLLNKLLRQNIKNEVESKSTQPVNYEILPSTTRFNAPVQDGKLDGIL